MDYPAVSCYNEGGTSPGPRGQRLMERKRSTIMDRIKKNFGFGFLRLPMRKLLEDVAKEFDRK